MRRIEVELAKLTFAAGDMPLNTYLEVAKINVLVVQLKERLLQVLTTYVPKKRGLREGEEEEGFST